MRSSATEPLALTDGQARRIALAAQGFGGPRDGPVGRRQLTALLGRLGVI